MHPARLVHYLRLLHAAAKTQQKQGTADDLDLSRFTPDPANTMTVYTFRSQDSSILVYARRPDSIVPYDRFVARFSRDGSANLILPIRAPRNSVYACLCMNLASFRLTCTILNAALFMPRPDWLLCSSLHRRLLDIARAMPPQKKACYRQQLTINGWPPVYREKLYAALL